MSGKLQIAISGLQNEFISGKPTFSHFLSVFKKHTKFAFNVNEFPLVNAKLGEETQCIIPVDSGDLINTLTLRWKLYYKASISSEHFTGSPANHGGGAIGRTYDDPFTPNVGMHGIDYAELYIGGTLIERITSDWIYLYHSYNKADYVFSNSVLYQTQATVATDPYTPSWGGEGTGSDAKTVGTTTEHIWRLKQMYIDLPFYFYNNLPASILACKLTKQNCYVKIKFKSHDKLVHPFLLPYTKDTNIESASILTKYTYLDNDELNYLKSRPIKQLITQTQLQQHDIPYNLLGDGASSVDTAAGDHLRIEIPLTLSNPIKNLYFFTVRKSRLHNKVAVYGYFPNILYGYYPNVFSTRYEYMMTTFFKSAGLKLNGNYLFNESYSKLVYDNRLNTSLSSFGGGVDFFKNRYDGSGSYSFALYPTSNEPSGHLNLNRIIDKKFVLEPTFLTLGVPGGYIQNYAQMPVGEPLELNIYGTCYNMLVYSDGLCGLKY